MKKILLIFCVISLFPGPAHALDISGYYEGQVTGWKLGDCLAWQAGNRLRLDFASDLGPGASVTGDVLAVTYAGQLQFNLLDYFPESKVRELESLLGPLVWDTFNYTFDATAFTLDNAFITWYAGPFSFRLGRQQLPWGTGYAWNPTDVFNVKDLLEPTYEKPGRDALKAEWGFGEAGGITLVFLPGATWQDSTRAVRGKMHVSGFDLSLSVIDEACTALDIFNPNPEQRETRRIFGGDFVGQVWEWGVWAEGAWLDGPGEEESWQLVLGTDTTFEFQTSLLVEYFRDSAGRERLTDYTLANWLDLVQGVRKTLGRDYVMLMVSHPVTALWTATMSLVMNVNDQSLVAVPQVVYNFSDNLDIALAGNIFTGSADSEFGALQATNGYLRLKAYF